MQYLRKPNALATLTFWGAIEIMVMLCREISWGALKIRGKIKQLGESRSVRIR